MKCVYEAFKDTILQLPYIPGFLAFREVPVLLELFQELKEKAPHFWPQILFVDGNGKLHPMGFGHASHLGVLVDIPTVGVGKTFFVVDGLSVDGIKNSRSQLAKQGDWFPLTGHSGAVWGAAVRTSKQAINPVFVSVGHRISLESAIKATMLCAQVRIPEPIRQADMRSREVIRRLVQAEAAKSAPSAASAAPPQAPAPLVGAPNPEAGATRAPPRAPASAPATAAPVPAAQEVAPSVAHPDSGASASSAEAPSVVPKQ
ncbi:putative Endonuclease V [Paratrimastix pyriformis]|uniref:Endonuclease V n=1 Tax=Paratrimastix pyriformis TaxID=342808 RepID=A0ABQ8UHR3_9EUKA|nr:putative Endonuclease V [Paratrimastix pyriformis]